MNSNDVVNLMFKWELELYRPQIKWDDVVSSCKIIQQSELIFCERELISIAMRLFRERKKIFSIANQYCRGTEFIFAREKETQLQIVDV